MKFKIATLNFSGINVSPFQYYDGSQQLQKLNLIYKKYINSFKPGIKLWEFKRLDPTYTSKRQSVVFDQLQFPDNSLPNRVQWQQIWNRRYIHYLKEGGTYKLDENQVQNAILFDYILYITICQFIYQDKQIESNFKKHNPNTLVQYLKKMKNRPSSISAQKGKLLLKYLQKQDLDILFLQQASSFDWSEQLKKNKLHDFDCKKNEDSVIIYKKESVGQQIKQLGSKYQTQLNFNQDSVSLFTNKQFLLISGHLKSNKQVNQQQINEMFITLSIVLKENQNLKLIVGIDANNFIQKVPQFCKFNIIPTTKDVPTTIKKRTSMQQQLHKADQLVSQVKDHIITNLKFQQDQHNNKLCIIQKVNGEKYLKELLPNDSHPYDHLIVKTKAQI